MSCEFSVGWAITGKERAAITAFPKKVWADAVDADGGYRDGVGLAEITHVLPVAAVSGYPCGIRVIVRRERPHPGAQLDAFEERPWSRNRVGRCRTDSARSGAHRLPRRGGPSMALQRRRTLSCERRAVLVVGHDRFPESDHALATAARLARGLQGFVHVVHAVSLDDYPINPDADDWEQQASAVLDAQRRTVERLLAGIVPEWSYEVRRGDPVDLLAAAAEADDALMIVVGTRGRGLATALARLVDQSVSHRVMLRQRRPVLVVPHPETPAPRAMRARS